MDLTLWKATITEITDLGNDTANVVVEFSYDGKVVKRETLNYHAGNVSLESAKADIVRKLTNLASFKCLGELCKQYVGAEIGLPEDVIKQIESAHQ